MAKEMQAAKRGTFNIIYGILGQAITICMGIIVPRLVLVSYGSEVNGLLNSTNQIFVYFSLFEAGVGVASLQALYQPVAKGNRQEINGILAATHQFYRKAGVLYALAVVILAFVYALVVQSELPYGVIVGVILFGGLGNCLNFLYQGKYKILMQAEGYMYVITNITTVINVLINVVKAVLLLMGFDVLAVQFSYFMITIVQMLIYYWYVHKHYSWIDLTVTPSQEALVQKNATLIHQISGIIFNNTDVLLLTLLLQNLKIVSVYSMYNMVISMITALIQQVSAGFEFRLGQIYNTNREQYFDLHHIFEIFYMIVVFSAMSVAYVFLLPFMRLYTANVTDINYIEQWYPLIFVIAPLLIYGRMANNSLINFAGHFKKTQWRSIFESAINLVVSLIAIPRLGIFGALLGTIVASVYRTNDMILYTYKYLLHDKPWRSYKRWLANIAIFLGIVLLVNQDNMRFDSYPGIILYGCLFSVVVLVLYTAVQVVINPRERRAFLTLIKPYFEAFRKKEYR